ncbi:serine/threonine protein kinase [Planctomycetota bacterium]
MDEIIDQNRFKIVRKLAEGGMGSVYEGILFGSNGFEKTVAIKTILEDYSSDSEFIDLFIGEAKLVADLVHGNIVQIYQLGKYQNNYYIAMEYVNGPNLEQYINRHLELGLPIPVDLSVYIIQRIARALEYAHNRHDREGNRLGVVHRDVSPKNVMINSEGFVKLTDFGIAKARNLMKNMEGEVLMGKAQYMSPEQARFQETDLRSDVFSAGTLLWELLSNGDVLFEGEDTADSLANVTDMPIPSIQEYNEEVTEQMSNILKRALDRDIDKRYQTAGMLAYDLEYYLYNEGFGPDFVSLERYVKELMPDLDSFDSGINTQVYTGDVRDKHGSIVTKLPLKDH